MPKRDPREFPEMPSARHRKERPHLVDIIADETSAPVITDKPGVPDKPGMPDTSEPPGKSDYKQTRQTKAGETVRRATFWFTDEDLEYIAKLQLIRELGMPDKSAVVREAVRRLAAENSEQIEAIDRLLKELGVSKTSDKSTLVQDILRRLTAGDDGE